MAVLTDETTGGSFENGWLTDAGAVVWTPSGAVAVVASGVRTPRHGGHCMEADGAAVASKYAADGFVAQTVINTRFYVDPTKLTTRPNSFTCAMFLNAAASWYLSANISILASGACYMSLMARDAGGGGGFTSTGSYLMTPDPVTGWVCVEMRLVLGAAPVGEMSLWLNGALQETKGGMDNNSTITRFYAGLFSLTFAGGDLYFDAVKTESNLAVGSPIGPMTAYPTSYVGPTLTGGIQELLDALLPAGGTVTLPAGDTTINASIELASNQTLEGVGDTTTISLPDDLTATLAATAYGNMDIMAGADRAVVSVADAAGLSLGWSVLVWSTTAGGTNWVQVRRVLAKEACLLCTALIFDYPIRSDMPASIEQADNGRVVHAFPAVAADAYAAALYKIGDVLPSPIQSPQLKKLKILGNVAQIANYYSFTAANIYFAKSRDAIIEDVTLDGCAQDGFCMVGYGVSRDTLRRCRVLSAARVGFHPGDSGQDYTFEDCYATACGYEGFYLCDDVAYSTFLRCEAVGCGLLGVASHNGGFGGIQRLAAGDTGDSYNVFEQCVSHGNLGPGFETVDDGFPTNGNRFINCRAYDNGEEGFSLDQSQGTVIQNALVEGNTGYGISMLDSSAAVELATLAGNTAGGVSVNNSALTALYSILRNPAGTEVTTVAGSAPTIQYSNVRGGYAGAGNQTDDPQLNADYTLKQLGAGDAVNSPCINAGLVSAREYALTIDGAASNATMATTRSDGYPDYGALDWGYHSLTITTDFGTRATMTARTFAEPTGDVRIAFDNLLDSGDLVIGVEDLESDRGLATAAIISLFTDRRAAADDTLPDLGSTDRRGWWGDGLADVAGDQIGSRIWLLEREKTTQEVILRAQSYAKEALQWMLDDKVAAKIEALAERQGEIGNDRLALQVTIHKTDGNKLSLRFNDVWQATAETVY